MVSKNHRTVWVGKDGHLVPLLCHEYEQLQSDQVAQILPSRLNSHNSLSPSSEERYSGPMIIFTVSFEFSPTDLSPS